MTKGETDKEPKPRSLTDFDRVIVIMNMIYRRETNEKLIWLIQIRLRENGM